MNDDELPTGRLARFSRIARVGTRTGFALLGDGSGKAAAAQAGELLGQLRGLAAKVGQMASYVDGFVPERQAEAYRQALAGLQQAASKTSFARVKELVESELGLPLEAAFAEFDPEALASASIGQVHRAKLLDGREVAVKVQHAGIGAAMESDLAAMAPIARLVAVLGPPGTGAEAIVKELQARFREELDYRHEAMQQETFRLLHERDSQIHIPELIRSHCTRAVFTSEFSRGMRFETARACDERTRQDYARCMWRFVHRSLLQGGRFNADPHPGNYLFHQNGRVTFLDFGSVQLLSDNYRRALPAMYRAAIDGDLQRFRDSARVALETREGAYESALHGYHWDCLEPLRSRRFRISREYVARMVRQIQQLKQYHFRRGAQPTPAPPQTILLNRLQFGFYSVLAGLDVELDYVAEHLPLLEPTTSPDPTESSYL